MRYCTGRRRIEMTHQQQISRTESHHFRNVLLASGVSIYPIAFVLKVDILSTSCNKHDVI